MFTCLQIYIQEYINRFIHIHAWIEINICISISKILDPILTLEVGEKRRFEIFSLLFESRGSWILQGFKCENINTFMYIYTYIFVYTYTHIYIFDIYICIRNIWYIYVYSEGANFDLHLCAYTPVYMYIYIYSYICIFNIYICIHNIWYKCVYSEGSNFEKFYNR